MKSACEKQSRWRQITGPGVTALRGLIKNVWHLSKAFKEGSLSWNISELWGNYRLGRTKNAHWRIIDPGLLETTRDFLFFFPTSESSFLLSTPWHYLGTVASPPATAHSTGNWIGLGAWRMWHVYVMCTVCPEIHSRVKQMEGIGFRHTSASLLWVFSVIHWLDSDLMVHLYMQLLGKERDKNVPRAVLLRFGSKKKQCK